VPRGNELNGSVQAGYAGSVFAGIPLPGSIRCSTTSIFAMEESIALHISWNQFHCHTMSVSFPPRFVPFLSAYDFGAGTDWGRKRGQRTFT
jgi:hypothetical protein